MPAYVAFLRAINLGPTRKFPKGDIVASAQRAGFPEVETYINTGNVLVRTPMRSRTRVEAVLEDAFAADRGFDVPTIAFTLSELAELAENAERIAAEHRAAVRHYISLLKHEPTPQVLSQLRGLSAPGVAVEVTGRAVHVVPDHVLGQGGPQNNRLERITGVATTRNRTVITALAERWC